MTKTKTEQIHINPAEKIIRGSTEEPKIKSQ